MKQIVFLSGLAFGIALNSSANIPPMSKMHRLNHLGHIQVGDSIDNLPSVSAQKKQFQLKKLSPRFHVYLFSPGLPANCMNLQCGAFARQVISKGGFLVGAANNRTPVVLVTDRADKVIAIYEDATTADLGMILAAVK
jgi:hypothetical protein